MREVIPGILWCGNALDARDIERVLALGVSAVIDLAMEEPPVRPPRDMVYCRFPLVDGAGNSRAVLQTAIHAAATFVRTRMPTLVSCSGGMSRSPAIAAAALALAERLPPDEALRQVTAAGPCDLSAILWAEVRNVLTRGQGR